jgi:hypothetical protein
MQAFLRNIDMHRIKNRQYVIRSASFPISWVVRDFPSQQKKGQDLLKQYLIDLHDTFRKKLELMLDTDQKFTQKDEDRLKAMLTLFIDARKTWQEEDEHPAT